MVVNVADDDVARDVIFPNRQSGRIYGKFVAVLGPAQSCFHFPLFVDVETYADKSSRSAIGVSLGNSAALVYPAPVTAASQNPILNRIVVS